jgi:Zn-dependent protease with chaperone function
MIAHWSTINPEIDSIDNIKGANIDKIFESMAGFVIQSVLIAVFLVNREKIHKIEILRNIIEWVLLLVAIESPINSLFYMRILENPSICFGFNEILLIVILAILIYKSQKNLKDFILIFSGFATVLIKILMLFINVKKLIKGMDKFKIQAVAGIKEIADKYNVDESRIHCVYINNRGLTGLTFKNFNSYYIILNLYTLQNTYAMDNNDILGILLHEIGHLIYNDNLFDYYYIIGYRLIEAITMGLFYKLALKKYDRMTVLFVLLLVYKLPFAFANQIFMNMAFEQKFEYRADVFSAMNGYATGLIKFLSAKNMMEYCYFDVNSMLNVLNEHPDSKRRISELMKLK